MLIRFVRRAGLILGAGAGVMLSGCLNPASHTGYHFEILKPPTIETHAVVQSGGNPMILQGQSNYGTVPMGYTNAPQAPTIVLQPQAAPQSMIRYPSTVVETRSSGDCLTLEDACARIRALEATRPSVLRPQAAPERIPAPKGVTVTPVPAAVSPCES